MSEINISINRTYRFSGEFCPFEGLTRLSHRLCRWSFNFSNGTDQIKISDWYASDDNRVEVLEFSDGTVWDISTLDYGGVEVHGLTDNASFEVIHGLEGENDRLYGEGGNDILLGKGGNDLLVGGLMDDILIGGDGIDTLDGGRGYDKFWGEAGNDILGSKTGEDYSSYQYNPTLNLNVGNDYWGGTGDDTLNGGQGADTYNFNVGDGMDTIDEIGGLAGALFTDKIILGNEIMLTDVRLGRENYSTDLLINFNNTTDSIRIKNWYDSNSNRVESLEFSSGIVWDVNALNYGGLEMHGTPDNVMVEVLLGLNDKDDRIYGEGGTDILVGNGGDDQLYGGSGNDSLYGGMGSDKLYGGAGGDVLGSKSGDDFNGYGVVNGVVLGNEYTGGTGTDTLNGSLYGDTYYFNTGDGMDTIDEVGGLSGDAYADKIILGNGITATDISLTRENTGAAAKTDLLINFNNNSTDQIRIKNWYGNDADRVESLVFADGSAVMDVVALTYGGLEVHGGAGIDYMYGLEDQNDRLYGEAGADYLFGFDGNDKLYGGNGTDTLVGFAGADELYGGNDNDVLYGLGDDDILDGGAGSDQLYGAEGNDILGSKTGADFYGFTTVGNKILGNEYWGGQGIDLLNGSYLGDTYYFNTGDGTDTIDETGGLSGDAVADKIILGEGISMTNIVLTRENTWGAAKTDLLINFNNNSTDQIRIKNWYGSDADRVESLVFADGSSVMDVTSLAYNGLEVHGGAGLDYMYGLENQADRLYGENGNDILFGFGGDDKLYGGNGVDTLVGFAGADELYGGNDNDKLFGLGDNDVLDGGAGSDTYFGGAGSDTLGSKNSDDFYSFTTVGNKFLGNEYWGGQGADTLNGSLFADTYYFNIGDGADTIDETRGVNVASYADTLVMGAGINSLDLIFRQDGNDLAVSRAGSADRVTVRDWYSGASNQVETIALNDGTELLNTQVDLMIQAMATFSTDNGSITWEQAIQDNSTEFQSLISAYWQPAV